jgi:TPR repeat protein
MFSSAIHGRMSKLPKSLACLGAILWITIVVYGSSAVAANVDREQATTDSLDFTRAKAAQGDVDAETELGARYALGDGMPKDEGAGVRWWSKAAQQGSADGEAMLGIAHYEGIGGVSKDKGDGLKRLRKALEDGSPVALEFLRVLRSGHNEEANVPDQVIVHLKGSPSPKGVAFAKCKYGRIVLFFV